MIKKIKINNVATFTELCEIELKKINYFYGFNASGKTTLTRVIDNPNDFNHLESLLEHEAGTENDDILVYNQDFVEDNFSDKNKIKGIYTLGKESGRTKKEIEQLKEEIFHSNHKLKELKSASELLLSKKDKLDEDFRNQAWTIKTTHEKTFKEALIGNLSKKETFKNNLINIPLDKNNLLTVDDLKKEYLELYSTQLIVEEVINSVNNSLSYLEQDKILNEVIKGSEKLSISELINKLNNSDWVKQGLHNVNETEKVCPFCQQNIDDDIFNQLKNYFNEEYERKLEKINTLKNQYIINSQIILEKLTNYKKNNYINQFETSSSKLEMLGTIIKTNIKNIDDKIKNPSKQIQLESSTTIINDINNIITNANENIKIHNEKVNNVTEHQNIFKKNLWNYFASEIEPELIKYKTNLKNIVEKINEKTVQIKSLILKITEKEKEIQSKESSITGIAGTIESINKILKSFGFESFKLKENDDKISYKVIRENGEIAKKLSESEERFIAFLYFYHLINGSSSSVGSTNNKVVVIDDPVCSMDSNTIFIVVALIKKLKILCLEDNKNIKQLLLLTHNVYFYREIVYPLKGEKKSKTHYFIIKKNDNVSSIDSFNENKIHNSYQLLWKEIKSKNKLTIANSMRRVLEYYFNLLGDKNYKDTLLDKFVGVDQIICNALLTFINAGSHTFPDEIDVIVDEETVDKYLEVFMKIFKETHNINHYNLMMENKESEEYELTELQKTEFNVKQN